MPAVFEGYLPIFNPHTGRATILFVSPSIAPPGRGTLIDQAQRVRSAPSSLATDVRFSSRAARRIVGAAPDGLAGLDNP
jgi:L-aminopeptidase/D-esterase-like protein